MYRSCTVHELHVRCGPCKMIAPHLEEMSKDTSVVFLKVDVDDCEDIAAEYKVNFHLSTNSIILTIKNKSVLSPLRYLLFLDHSHAYLHLHQEQAEGGGPDWRQYREAEGDCRSQQIRHRLHFFPSHAPFKTWNPTHCSTYLWGMALMQRHFCPSLSLITFLITTSCFMCMNSWLQS